MYLPEKNIKQIRDFLIERLSPYLIVIFGSAVSGNMRDDSDVDIAFLSDKEVSAYYIFEAAQEIAEIIGHEVDLVDLSCVSTVFQAQIVGKGRIIYDADPERRKYFYMMVLTEYARLNEEREPVLTRIRERGSVYG